MTIQQDIQIGKARVFDEVAKTTAYIGKKATSAQDPDAYERVAVVDANREQLDRYWTEACDGASLTLDHWVVSQTAQTLTHHPELDRDYNITLGLTDNWNWAYLTTVREVLSSYLVNSMVAKWLLVVLPSQAEAYGALAAGDEKRLRDLMLVRKRPVPRVTVAAGAVGDNNGIWGSEDLWGGPQTWDDTDDE